MPSRGLDQQQVYALIARLAGQANILTIPRLFIDWTGDHISALLLSQVVYWSSRTDDAEGWFYKSAKDWDEELGISDYQLARATKKLAEAGLETKLRKVAGAPTLHYRLDQTAFLGWISEKLGNGFPTPPEVDFRETGKWISESLVNGLPSSSEMDRAVSQESLTETTAEITAERRFETSKGRDEELVITMNDRILIGRYVEDLARELRDQAPLASTTTRACRLYVESGLSIGDFTTAMLEARRKTQEHSGTIKARAADAKPWEPKTKMAYWFAVLEDLAGLRRSREVG